MGRFRNKILKYGERNAVKYADEIIVLSKNVQNYFKETYGRDTVFIPNGVERPVIKNDNEINKKYGLKKNDYILFLGRIVPEKQVKLLIEAYKNLETIKSLSLQAVQATQAIILTRSRNVPTAEMILSLPILFKVKCLKSFIQMLIFTFAERP